MRKALLFVLLAGYVIASAGDGKENGNAPKANPPIYIAFLWHMHQPIYWPYESIVQTDANSRFPFSVTDIHNQRTGPYTSWPRNAVEKGITANLPHFGAQVSFTGSLIENLNNLEDNGNGNFSNWKSNWNAIRPKKTSLNNPRMDLVAFGYFHPLMGLIDYEDIRKQVQYHKNIFTQNFPGSYSKGMFPPENAFTNRMIPALVAEGIEWILVDNVHFDRACVGYPFSTVGNIYEPNKADQLNPNPNDWVQLNGLWAPTKNSAKWGRQPHWVEYVDPATGTKTKMIAVPADRYMGNEDGRGGFGALNYENVMSQLESYNTDPNHPILIVLHHDGDNYGGGSEGYYGGNFQSFVNWVQANPSRFVCSTVQDYLQMFPPAETDIIHVEEGSWSGADNGDPEFKKWLGDPDAQGYSPDRNSWGVLTAAKNLVFTAEQNDPNNANTQTAWKNLLCGEASDYWYWDGSLGGIWDTHPTRAANLAIQAAQLVSGTDNTPPTIFIPQREPYNPGGTEWNISQTSNMSVWSYVFDKSGLQSVTLKYRVDTDGSNAATSIDNETYAGGADVGSWIAIPMTGADKPSSTNPPPVLKAKEFTASIDGLKSKLIDYYIEATDNNNNTAKTPIRHCWIGDGSGSGGTGNLNISWAPLAATKNDTITVVVKNAPTGAKLHWGVNNTGATWQMPDSAYWPAGTVKFSGTGPAVESPFIGPDTAGTLTLKIGPFNLSGKVVDRVAFVIHFNDNTWNNNGGNDYHITFDTSSGTPTAFVMDGQLDSKTITASTSGTEHLYIGWNGTDLYVATESAQASGNDAFIFVSDSLRGLIAAPWGKAGKVAQWGAYLANESTNNYVTWSDATGTNAKAAGAILEGTLRINGEFGYIPAKLYIAVGKYATTDSGALLKQLPAGNGNGDIENVEFFAFDYVTVGNTVTQTLRPVSLELMQNYPNPFNPSTVINYYLPKSGKTLLKVYDVLGNEVRTLVEHEQEQGIHYAQFDASSLSSGVYYYTLTAGGERLTRKMLMVK